MPNAFSMLRAKPVAAWQQQNNPSRPAPDAYDCSFSQEKAHDLRA